MGCGYRRNVRSSSARRSVTMIRIRGRNPCPFPIASPAARSGFAFFIQTWLDVRTVGGFIASRRRLTWGGSTNVPEGAVKWMGTILRSRPRPAPDEGMPHQDPLESSLRPKLHR